MDEDAFVEGTDAWWLARWQREEREDQTNVLMDLLEPVGSF